MKVLIFVKKNPHIFSINLVFDSASNRIATKRRYTIVFSKRFQNIFCIFTYKAKNLNLFYFIWPK